MSRFGVQNVMTDMDPPSPEASARQARELSSTSSADARRRCRSVRRHSCRVQRAAVQLPRPAVAPPRDRGRSARRNVAALRGPRPQAASRTRALDRFCLRWLATCISATAAHASLEDSQTADAIGLWPLGTPRPSPFESTVANETGRRIEEALRVAAGRASRGIAAGGCRGHETGGGCRGLRHHSGSHAPASQPRPRGDRRSSRRMRRPLSWCT